MPRHEMDARPRDMVRYTQGRAAVRYKLPAEVVDVRYLPYPDEPFRHRKPPPDWLQTFGMILLFRIMPVLLVLALVILLVRSIFTS